MTVVSLPYEFAAGTRIIADQVDANFNALTNAFSTNVRTFIPAATTFYVASNGIDTPGNGLAATSPAATITYILGLLRTQYDLNNQQVTIQLANGTYNETVNHYGPLIGLQIEQNLIIQGNMAAPSQVIWNSASGANNSCIIASNGSGATIQGVTMQSAASHCIQSASQSTIIVNNVVFGSTPNGAHIQAIRGGIIFILGNYTITGGAQYHIGAIQGGIAQVFDTTTLTGTPNFTTAFAYATDVGCLQFNNTFSGAATGPRSLADRLAIIDIGGQGATYLPGNVAGTTTNGGVTA